MDLLSAAASIFTVLQVTGEVVGYLKDVKNAPKACQDFQAEASSLYALLNNILFSVNEETADEAWNTSVRALTVENGPLDQYKQALEQLLSKLEIQDRVQKVKRQLMWKFRKEEVSSIISRMERLKSFIQIARSTDHFKLSQSIKNDTASIPLLQANTNVIRETQSVQQNQSLLQWLSPFDFPTQQQDMISRRQEGTAQWFLDSAEFKRWTDGTDKTLFCPGIPGAGKTMMAAVGIDHLNQTTNPNDTGLAYLFCSYKSQFEQSARNMFAALLKQLVQPRPDLVALLEDLQKNHRGGKASCEEIYKALQTVCSAYKTVYLIVDALDEYGDQDGTRSGWIYKLLQLQASTDVRILFTSRELPTITENFKTTLTLEVRATAEDVRRYVEGQLPRLPGCIRRDQDLRNRIANTVTKSADGMFLLAQLHVESFHHKRNRFCVLSTLDKISQESRTLDEAYSKRYDEAIERIESQSLDDKSLAKRALCWISYAQRLLTTDELSCALAIGPGDRSLNDDKLYDVEDIASVCAGLVTVDVESRVIRLVHYTTQEYFERIRLTWNPEAQIDIATACLTCLCFDTFQSGDCDTNAAFKQRLAENKFFAYSAEFWVKHVRSVQTDVSELALTFLCNGNLVKSAEQAATSRRYIYIVRDLWLFPFQTNGLQLAAQHGLQILTELLIKHEKLGLEVDAKTEGMTPLHFAARYGHEAVARLLLETGKADPTSRGRMDQTPLSLAAIFGHEPVVRLLLQIDKVDVNSKNSRGMTPLLRAAKNGHDPVVRLLLQTGKVEIDSRDKFDRTPLMEAAMHGYETVVQLLLQTGKVDINSRDHNGYTPLAYAAKGGHDPVVRLLLQMDKVEIDSKDILGKTPLMIAAERGHEEVVRLLEALRSTENN